MKVRFFRVAFCFLISASILFGCRSEEETPNLIPVSEKALFDTSSVWYGDFGSYPSELSDLPIGIITSQVEEIAVMESFLKGDYFDNITGEEVPDGIPDFAGEKFYLLLDYANGPYRGYDGDTSSINLLRDITVKNALMLMSDRYFIIPDDEIPTGVKDPVKFIVNVSDASGLFCQGDVDTLLSLSGTGVNSLSLVSAGIEAAADEADSESGIAVGILASGELYSSDRYEEMVRAAVLKTGVTDKIQVFSQLCIGLDESLRGDVHYCDSTAFCIRENYLGPVLGMEEDDIDVNMMDRYRFSTRGNSLVCAFEGRHYSSIQLNSPENYVRFHLVSLIEKHRRSGSTIPLKAIVLGNRCDALVLDTLKSVLSELYDFRRDGQYIYRNSIAEDVVFIDPVECLVKKSYKMLRESRRLAFNTSRTDLTSFMTVPSPDIPVNAIDTVTGAYAESFKYDRLPGMEKDPERMVPFAMRYINPASFRFTQTLFPESIRQIKKKLY